MSGRLRRLLVQRAGQGQVEYALILALVVALLVGALILMKNEFETSVSSMTNEIGTATKHTPPKPGWAPPKPGWPGN